MFDLIIKNGDIVDGSGERAFKADIGIKDGYITTITPEIQDDSKNIIDAQGYVVCPGFIDIHSHSDFTLFINPRGESKIRQGITTEVVGNCGFTAAPVREEHFEDLLLYLANTVILSDDQKKKWKWASQADFLEEIGSEGFSFNIASLVGHGTIRVAVMGFDKRKPTPGEMNRMLKLLEAELDAGLFGLSTGLEYEPCLYADHDELVELARLTRSFNGIYAVHLRNEGKDVLRCISESIEIAEKSDVSLEISHLKAAFRSNWGRVNDALKLIDTAKVSGLNVDFDIYPYTAYGSGLIDLIPAWAKEQGVGKMLEILRDESLRVKVLKDMAEENQDWENPGYSCGWDNIRIATLKSNKNRKYEGMSIQQIAEDMGCAPWEATVRLTMEEEAAIKAVYFAMSEEDVETCMRHPGAIFCTDGRAVAPYGSLGRGSVHPRYYGTYPRILGRYVREKGIIPIEEAIKKMTYLPARKVGLEKRGLLREGYYADITIFNKSEVLDLATFEQPHQYSRGIEYVIVNGQVVIEKGEHTGKLPGRVLKRKKNR